MVRNTILRDTHIATINPDLVRKSIERKYIGKFKKVMVAILLVLFFILGFIAGVYYTTHEMVDIANDIFKGSNLKIDIDLNESELVKAIAKYTQNTYP